MQFTNTVGYLLHHLAFKLDAQSDKVLLDKYGIGFAQFKLLLVLQERNGIRQRDIANSLEQSEAGISRQIKILRSKGFVKAQVSKENRRVRVITLTLQGEHMIERASYTLNVHHAYVFENLSEKQQEQLREHLLLLENRLR